MFILSHQPKTVFRVYSPVDAMEVTSVIFLFSSFFFCQLALVDMLQQRSEYGISPYKCLIHKSQYSFSKDLCCLVVDPWHLSYSSH